MYVFVTGPGSNEVSPDFHKLASFWCIKPTASSPQNYEGTIQQHEELTLGLLLAKSITHKPGLHNIHWT